MLAVHSCYRRTNMIYDIAAHDTADTCVLKIPLNPNDQSIAAQTLAVVKSRLRKSFSTVFEVELISLTLSMKLLGLRQTKINKSVVCNKNNDIIIIIVVV